MSCYTMAEIEMLDTRMTPSQARGGSGRGRGGSGRGGASRRPSSRPSSIHRPGPHDYAPFKGNVDGTIHVQHQFVQFPKQNGGWQHSKIVFGKGHSCINTLMAETGCNIVQPKWKDVKPEHKKLFPFFYIEGPTGGHVLDAAVRVMKLLMTSMSRERFDLLKAADEFEEIIAHQKLKIADMEQEQAPQEYRPTSPAYEPHSPPPIATSPPKEAEKPKPKKLNLVANDDESEDEDDN